MEALVALVIWLCVLGLIVYVLFWAIDQVPLPEPIKVVTRVIIVLVLVLILCQWLFGILPPPPGHILRSP